MSCSNCVSGAPLDPLVELVLPPLVLPDVPPLLVLAPLVLPDAPPLPLSSPGDFDPLEEDVLPLDEPAPPSFAPSPSP